MRCFSVIGLLLLSVQPLTAQVKDTTKKYNASEIQIYSIKYSGLKQTIDTSLEEFYDYRITARNQHFYLDLGNYGSATYPIVFKPIHYSGIHLGFDAWDIYGNDNGNPVLYSSEHPFTNLLYVQGIAGEQVFSVTHSETIKKSLNFGVDFYGIRTPGTYQHQMAKSKRVTVYANYTNRSGRYRAIMVYHQNKTSNLMNGGVKDSVFFKASPKTVVDVFLNQALSEYGRKSILLNQAFYIAKPAEKAINDSVDIRYIDNPWKVFHTLSVSKESYSYQDVKPALSYYPQILLRSDSTLDNTFILRLENKVGIKYFMPENQKKFVDSSARFYGQLYAMQQYTNIDQQGRQYPGADYYAGMDFHIGKVENKINFSGNYDVAGTNAGTFDASINFNKTFSRWAVWTLEAEVAKTAASFTSEHYLSNHYYFEKTLNPVSWSRYGFRWRIPAIDNDISVNYNRVSNQIVYDSLSIPRQLSAAVSIWQAAWNSHFSLGHFHLISHIIVQVSSHPDSLPLPLWSSRHSFYYEAPLFKNAIRAQMGIQLSYHSAWYAPAFNPVLGQFYLQNEILLSTYPVIDLFFSFRLKTARLFFIGENLNQALLFPDGYYASPGYPAGDRTFRFGVNWLLFN